MFPSLRTRRKHTKKFRHLIVNTKNAKFFKLSKVFSLIQCMPEIYVYIFISLSAPYLPSPLNTC